MINNNLFVLLEIPYCNKRQEYRMSANSLNDWNKYDSLKSYFK